MFFAIVAVGIHGYLFYAINGGALFGFQYAVGYARWVLKMLLPPVVGLCFVFLETTFLFHLTPIDVFFRPYLLIHRHAE